MMPIAIPASLRGRLRRRDLVGDQPLDPGMELGLGREIAPPHLRLGLRGSRSRAGQVR